MEGMLKISFKKHLIEKLFKNINKISEHLLIKILL